MATHRIERINEEIRKELARILPTVKDPRVPKLISVTAVETTGDLKECKVFVSALEGSEEDMLRGLKSSGSYIRGALSRGLRLRYTPELSFHADPSIKYGLHINEKLHELGLDGNGEEADESE
ncbi:MAG: 30S ribosome-binding factor RbfA [Clostridiales bacterium]|nr:MAG: 30S ribosome-binding factor RbfA [Clostridiales bacterium]